jgi:hypothetical protein
LQSDPEEISNSLGWSTVQQSSYPKALNESDSQNDKLPRKLGVEFGGEYNGIDKEKHVKQGRIFRWHPKNPENQAILGSKPQGRGAPQRSIVGKLPAIDPAMDRWLLRAMVDVRDTSKESGPSRLDASKSPHRVNSQGLLEPGSNAPKHPASDSYHRSEPSIRSLLRNQIPAIEPQLD